MHFKELCRTAKVKSADKLHFNFRSHSKSLISIFYFLNVRSQYIQIFPPRPFSFPGSSVVIILLTGHRRSSLLFHINQFNLASLAWSLSCPSDILSAIPVHPSRSWHKSHEL